jgi:preprotein translocase subunit SecG
MFRPAHEGRTGQKKRGSAADMAFLYYLIIFLHIVACLFLIAVVLLQQGKGQDLASAFGGGGTQTAFGPRGSATVLSRATTILAGVFMVTSLTLSLMPRSRSGVLDQVPGVAATPTPAATAAPASVPTIPATPAEAPAGTPAPAPTPAK